LLVQILVLLLENLCRRWRAALSPGHGGM